MAHPIILYVPGCCRNRSPRCTRTRCCAACWRACGASTTTVAEAVATTAGGFDIVSWTYDFYREHRDFEIDREAIENVISQRAAASATLPRRLPGDGA